MLLKDLELWLIFLWASIWVVSALLHNTLVPSGFFPHWQSVGVDWCDFCCCDVTERHVVKPGCRLHFLVWAPHDQWITSQSCSTEMCGTPRSAGTCVWVCEYVNPHQVIWHSWMRGADCNRNFPFIPLSWLLRRWGWNPTQKGNNTFLRCHFTSTD